MTSAREIEQIFGPLMKRNSCLAQISPSYLWLHPVRHVALRVLIERSSDKGICWPQWTMLHTFIPGWDLMNGIGYRGGLVRPASSQETLWRWSDPTMIDTAITVIETHALPHLASIDSLQAFWALYRGSAYRAAREWPEDGMIFEIAMGELDAARTTWHSLEPQLSENRYPDDTFFQSRRNKIMTVAEPLLAGDRPALAKILHGWEADNIRGTKIERYWEPTPFPLETAPA